MQVPGLVALTNHDRDGLPILVFSHMNTGCASCGVDIVLERITRGH
jgi:hypothetical protein